MPAEPSPRLSLHTVEDMFDKLKLEEARLLESWSVYDSFNFIVTAHHLYYDSILCSQHMRSRSRGDSTYSLVQGFYKLVEFFRLFRNVFVACILKYCDRFCELSIVIH